VGSIKWVVNDQFSNQDKNANLNNLVSFDPVLLKIFIFSRHRQFSELPHFVADDNIAQIPNTVRTIAFKSSNQLVLP